MSEVPPAAADYRFRDRAVYLTSTETLVLADLHIGRDGASEVSASLEPTDDLVGRLTTLLAFFEPGRVVFAGDLLHQFSRVSDAARETVDTLRAACLDAGADPVAVAGNHDTRLADCWPTAVHDSVMLDDETVVCHGHEEPAASGMRYIIGHDHPAITIEGVRRPCFLFGEATYRGGDLLVLPAFTRLAGGVEVNNRRSDEFQSPLVTDLGSLRPVVADAADADPTDVDAAARGSRDDAADAGGTMATSFADPLWFPPLASFRRLL